MNPNLVSTNEDENINNENENDSEIGSNSKNNETENMERKSTSKFTCLPNYSKTDSKEKDKLIKNLDSRYNKNQTNNYNVRNRKKKWNTQNQNIGGVRIYNKYQELLKKKEQIRKKNEEEKLNEEKKELTFHPKISEKSRKLVKELDIPIEDKLIEYGNMKKKNLIKKQYERRLNEMNQITYSPVIDSFSRELGNKMKKKRIETMPSNLSGIKTSYIKMKNNNTIDTNDSNRETERDNKRKKEINQTYFNDYNYMNKKLRSKTPVKSSNFYSDEISMSYNSNHKNKNFEIKPDSNLFDYLYLESRIIQKKKNDILQKNLKQECPFTPRISKNTQIMVNHKKETKGEFIKRLVEKKNKCEEIIILPHKKNSIKENNYKLSNIPGNSIVNSFKDGFNQIINSENDDLRQKEFSNTMDKKQIYLKNTTEIIVKRKIEKIKQIFNMLDSDQDGFISCDNIKLSNLNEKLLSVLTPFIEELYSNKDNLTFREFYDKVEPILSNSFF